MKNYITIIFYILSFSTLKANATEMRLDTVPHTQNIGNVSTTWDDFSAASPHAEIPAVELISPSHTGEANILFPIKLPEARNGLQPELGLNYANEGGNGWLGLGWNLGFSSFTLDTRWGVPHYSGSKESEIYLFDGEQLGPVFHREQEYDREAERTFYMRQETEFQKIIRHGNSPTNYWWEVTETDGTKHYYGGTPEAGLSSTHTLATSAGQITEWHLAETRDKYDNYIGYNYTKVNHAGGSNIYPSSVFYNGHGTTPGKYEIQFLLQTGPKRIDVSSSARTGMKQVTADLLSEIQIKYDGALIRSYRLEYTTGMFSKTLLNSISEYDLNNELFYTYDCEYYNDLVTPLGIEAFESFVPWDIGLDAVADGSIVASIDAFDFKPTLLGGALSNSVGGGLAITVGPPFNPITKDYSAGPNSSFTSTTSEGVTALIDINGDGLPDKLFKTESGLRFRPNLHSDADAPLRFGNPIDINNLKDFSLSNTFAWTVGAEVNVAPVFGAYFHEESTTKVTTFLADFNGDELIDISHNETVYFNHINNAGEPTFTTVSSDTPSIIYKGEESSNDPPDPAELAMLAEQNPLHDAVRTWTAPFTGSINISGDIQLQEDMSQEAQDYGLKDGVICFIQQENFNLDIIPIDADDYSVKNIDLDVNVNQGDILYFRVNSRSDGLYDVVNWDPMITYQNSDLTSVNADCIPEYIFQASREFVVSENTETILPKDGTVQIIGDFKKPQLTDSLRLVVEGAIDTTIIFAPSEAYDGVLTLGEHEVLSGDKVQFSIYSVSNIDWPKILWNPVLEYTAFEDGSDVTNSEGEAVISICPKVDLGIYQTFGFHPELYVAQEDGILNFEAITLAVIGDAASFNYILKIKNKLDSVKYALTEPFGEEYRSTINAQVQAGDSIYIEFTYNFNEAVDLYTTDSSIIELNGNTSSITCGANLDFQEENNLDGLLYRGWGQMAYNPVGDFPLFPMDLAGMVIDTSGIAGDTALVDEDVSSEELDGNNINPESKILVLNPDQKQLLWIGGEKEIFVSATQIGSSRLGLKNVSSDGAAQVIGAGISSHTLITKTRGDGGFGGLGFGLIEGSAGGTGVDAWSELDITDMNGDRYPDEIKENEIIYTNQKGGMSSENFEHSWGTHGVSSFAWVFGLGRHSANSGPKNAGASAGKGSNKSSMRSKQKGRSAMSKARGAFKSAKNSVGINGSLSGDEDSADHTFLDINGDGLEDKLWSNGNVRINLGYEYGAIENWGFTDITNGVATDGGAGLGVNISNGSIQAGISLTATTNQTQLGFIDLNDDALLDRIVSVDPMMVQFNTGNGFTTTAVEWLNESEFDSAVSVGESLNGAVTFCIEFVFFRVCFNPSTYAGQGTNGVRSAFQDIDGDGYVDYLNSKGDNADLSVRRSKIGRTNFLKKLSNPTVGSMEFDYDYVGNTYDLPFSKWVITSATIDDGVANDGQDILKREFVYEEGKYDRHERQFYGFGKVRDLYLDDGERMREVVSEYMVDSYYTKGINTKQQLYDGAGKLYKEIEQLYFLRDPETGINLPDNFAQQDNGMAFPALAQKTTSFYEGQNIALSNSLIYEYDTLNVISSILDIDEAGSTKQTSYTYDHDFDNYYLDRITKEIITGNGILLRETNYELNEKGNQIQVRRKIDASQEAITDFSYDNYGNLIQLIRPTNYKGERLQYDYSYDEFEHQHLTSESDSYGYEKTYTHEYLFNQLTSYKDINNNETVYEYDAKGRQHIILYPYENNLGVPYSVRFEYFPFSSTPYAKVSHFDPEHGTDIDSYFFEDGLQRNIQIKSFAELTDENGNTTDGFIVSGIDKYDALGRIVESYLPNTEGTNNPTIFNDEPDGEIPSFYEYDPLDRIINEIDPYFGITEYEYTISEDNMGRRLLEQKIINPLKNERASFFNTRGELNATWVQNSGTDIWTHYFYDDISQVQSILDPYGNETSYEYDLIGRRISVKVPDAGLTTLVYDQADNLRDRITATIRDVISNDGSIRYSYDYERLVQIDYPKHFENKVQIHYGTAQDSFNRAGRIWLQEDATGGREYFFDINGNPTKTIRTVMINRSKVFTYVSENEYDGWGRIQKMKYADGEEVDYAYDKAGMLSAMAGDKEGSTFNYIEKLGYDKFKDRVYMSYGNGSIDTYRYDNKGRLVKRKTFGSNQVLLSDETYTYDLVDNLIQKENIATGSEDLGGSTIENYSYDPLQRMSTAEGSWNKDSNQDYQIFFDYDDLNNLTMKGQSHNIDGNQEILTTRMIDFVYESEDQPTRPSEVGGKNYFYDPNGNLLLRNSISIFDYDQNIFDEENRLLGSSNNGYISRYTYDAFGRRALKSHGEIQGVFINGAPAGFIEHKSNYKVEVSPYFTVTENEYRKHYFIDQHRVLSKIGTGVFQTTIGDGPEITAGGIDYKLRMQQYEQSILDYYSSLEVPPGPPGLLAQLGQPEFNETSLPDASTENPYNLPPTNWPNLAPPDTLGPPGIPIFYENANLSNENVEAGFNFTTGNLVTELENFYYHYDHNKSTQYVTDYAGNPRQYAVYFPSGEQWILQRKTFDGSSYFFNGLTLDEETGFYNMGDIYYDPVTNVEMSIDPVLQNFGESTFLKRNEGSFYYEYAEESNTDASFDAEILNSERPEPFLGNTVNNIDQLDPDHERIATFKTKGRKKHLAKEKFKQKLAVAVADLAEITVTFDNQDADSQTSFNYTDFTSFYKAKLEEKNYKKRRKEMADNRKGTKRKVKFKKQRHHK